MRAGWGVKDKAVDREELFLPCWTAGAFSAFIFKPKYLVLWDFHWHHPCPQARGRWSTPPVSSVWHPLHRNINKSSYYPGFSQRFNNSVACIVPPPRTSWSVPHNIRTSFVLLFFLVLNWSVQVFFILKFKTIYLCLFQVPCSVWDETMPTCAQICTSTESYLFVCLVCLGLDFVLIGRQ